VNYKMVGRIVALTLLVEAAFLLPPLALCLADGEGGVALAFLASIGVILLAAGALWLLSRGRRPGFYAREGLVCVALCWVAMSLLGCLPFVFSGQIPNYIDALFEIVSGFTTTGSSILPEVESLSRGILYWRSFSHWLGGMGVLVFLLALVPLASRSEGYALHLMRAESPGPSVGKLVPRLKQTAAILYGIYFLLTVLNVAFLLAGGMPWFDALCTAYGTAGTGGFATRNDSMASFSPYLQNVCTVFMMLFGVNFGCYYLLLLRRFADFFGDEEVRLYFGIAAGSTVLIALNLRGRYATVEETVRHAAFQVSSIMTTTGFASTDFDRWPSFSKSILLCLMIVGACAGSTGGGLKCSRVLLLGKTLRRDLLQLLHPRRVQAVRINGRAVDERIVAQTNAYLAVYVLIAAVSFMLISLDGFSLTTNFSAVLSCFNNIGPGLDSVGPAANFGGYSALSKLVLIFDMLAGRLEIFPMLALFSPTAWRRG